MTLPLKFCVGKGKVYGVVLAYTLVFGTFSLNSEVAFTLEGTVHEKQAESTLFLDLAVTGCQSGEIGVVKACLCITDSWACVWGCIRDCLLIAYGLQGSASP